MLGMYDPLRIALVASLLPLLASVAPASAAVVPRGSCTQMPVAMGWFANWEDTDSPSFGLANMNWTQYTRVSYAFLEPGTDQSIPVDGYDTQLKLFVQEAHTHNVNASVTVGGWTGSLHFSSAVATEQSRGNFVNAAVQLVNNYDLDGLDFDWEYPSQAGVGCNEQSPNDASNYLLFLQELRSRLPSKTLSAAVGLKPFLGSSGSPMSDVSGFYSVLDYIEPMNYDVFGSFSSSVGPNSPLADACAPTADQEGSAMSAVKAWSAAGFKADKIVLGVAGYGHSFKVAKANAYVSAANKTLRMYAPFDAAGQPNGDSWDTAAPGTTATDVCGNTSSAVTGIFNYWGMYQKGFLDADGNPADGIDYLWDSCSSTPFVYNPNTQTMVSYDNAESFLAKGQYIREAGLRGWAMWEAASDYNNTLVEAIRSTTLADYNFGCMSTGALMAVVKDVTNL
ncbi:glycoside hydrolase superfamily [Fomitopsis serialis]|uniref:glycoside hydrolase superfamily n=1 Tax=Fomitopsis serialis TaxID=139415 RepID=UPI002008A17A|nr:glycoside hydrolase superfamily [Neoantrodia serialis]KAH9926799.1 glycoside hydrolase superfamily [Neoantrodia serialis]